MLRVLRSPKAGDPGGKRHFISETIFLIRNCRFKYLLFFIERKNCFLAIVRRIFLHNFCLITARGSKKWRATLIRQRQEFTNIMGPRLILKGCTRRCYQYRCWKAAEKPSVKTTAGMVHR